MLEREIGRNAKNLKKSGDLPPEREIRHPRGVFDRSDLAALDPGFG